MVRFLNTAFGMGVFALFVGVQPIEPASIWEGQTAEIGHVAELEAAFETQRGDADLGAELADEYLREREPELAVAALRALDVEAQRDPLVQHRFALAYADMGQIADAVSSARLASSRCMRSLEQEEYAPGMRRCSETTLTRIEMNREALERLNRWGIVDPDQDPARTALAYRLSYRVARLAVSQK